MKVSYPQIILGTAEIVQLRLWLAKIGGDLVGLEWGRRHQMLSLNSADCRRKRER